MRGNKLKMNNRKNLIVGSLVLLILVVIFALSLFKEPSQTKEVEDVVVHRGLAGEPVDVLLDFYGLWLDKRQATSTSEVIANPLESQALSVRMQEKLKGFDFTNPPEGLDPVLCQNVLPTGFRTKDIFVEESKVQIMVLAKKKAEPGQAAVTLNKHNDLWEITDIACSLGEQAPEMGEFSFDNEGLLLKDSLPSSFDKQYWYLVFSQDDTPGYTTPLLIDSESICSVGGSESVCTMSSFSEAMRVHVQGEMSEDGVSVKKVEVMR